MILLLILCNILSNEYHRFIKNASLYSTQAIVEAARKRNHYVRVLDHMLCDLVIEEESRPFITIFKNWTMCRPSYLVLVQQQLLWFCSPFVSLKHGRL